MSGLKKGALSLLGVIAATCAFMGPATAVYFNTGIGIQNAGNAIGFAFVLAMIATLFVAYTIAQFAKKLPSAGFAYTYSVRGIGPRAGFLTGWLLLGGYAMVAPMMLAAIGYFFNAFFVTYFHLHIAWSIFSIIVGALILLLTSLGVTQSVRVALVMLVIEVVVMLALFATVLGHGGAEGISFAAFNPHNTVDKPYNWNGIGIAMLWAILNFVGFESAATLGEETKNPKRNIPRALYIAVIGIGIYFLLAAFTAVVGYGPSHLAGVVNSVNKGGNPWDPIFSTYWGSAASVIIMLVILNSIFANLLSGFNAVVRILYAMGSESVLAKFLGEVSETRQVPVKAATFYMIVSLTLCLVLGYVWSPMTAYGWTGTILGLCIVIVYVIINISLIPFYKLHHSSEFGIVKHVVMPIIAIILLYLPLKGVIMSVLPAGGGAAPFIYIPYVVLAWIIIGALYMMYLYKSKTEVFQGMGRVFEG